MANSETLLTDWHQVTQLFTTPKDFNTGIYVKEISSEDLLLNEIDQSTSEALKPFKNALIFSILHSHVAKPIKMEDVEHQYTHIAAILEQAQALQAQLLTSATGNVSFRSPDENRIGELYRDNFGEAINWIVSPPSGLLKIAMFGGISFILEKLLSRKGIQTVITDNLKEAVEASLFQAEVMAKGEKPTKTNTLLAARRKKNQR